MSWHPATPRYLLEEASAGPAHWTFPHPSLMVGLVPQERVDGMSVPGQVSALTCLPWGTQSCVSLALHGGMVGSLQKSLVHGVSSWNDATSLTLPPSPSSTHVTESPVVLTRGPVRSGRVSRP